MSTPIWTKDLPDSEFLWADIRLSGSGYVAVVWQWDGIDQSDRLDSEWFESMPDAQAWAMAWERGE